MVDKIVNFKEYKRNYYSSSKFYKVVHASLVNDTHQKEMLIFLANKLNIDQKFIYDEIHGTHKTS